MPFSVYPIDTLHVNDNYAWAIIPEGSNKAYVVDPGEAEAVQRWLSAQELQLAGIIVTHRHWDHVNGIEGLLAAYGTDVWGPRIAALPRQTHFIEEGAEVLLGGQAFRVLAIPGHTEDHIAYYCATTPQPVLFCGDTLFAAGCGRVLGGTVEELYNSLQRLAQLPPNTQIYCAHEYTLTNLAFAETVEPANTAIIKRKEFVEHLRARGKVTLPSQLSVELETNPFLRCEVPAVAQAASEHAGRPLKDAVDVFAALRRWKDTFRPS